MNLKGYVLMGFFCAGLYVPKAEAETIKETVHWSSDGSRMVVVVNQDIILYDASGNVQKRHVASDPVGQFTLASDASRAAFTIEKGEARIIDLETGVSVIIHSGMSNMQFIRDFSWSIDSKHLTFTVRTLKVFLAPFRVSEVRQEVYFVNADGSGKRLLVEQTIQ